LQQYKESKIFEDNLDEFDDSAEVVKNLINEYAASEKSNYNYGSEDTDMQFDGH
jgi:tubulin gamma